MTTLYGDIIDNQTHPAEAGKKLAEIWARDKTEEIDVWRCDWVCEEFANSFLTEVHCLGCFEQAKGIRWRFHISPGPANEITLHDLMEKWIESFNQRVQCEK